MEQSFDSPFHLNNVEWEQRSIVPGDASALELEFGADLDFGHDLTVDGADLPLIVVEKRALQKRRRRSLVQPIFDEIIRLDETAADPDQPASKRARVQSKRNSDGIRNLTRQPSARRKTFSLPKAFWPHILTVHFPRMSHTQRNRTSLTHCNH
jgi:hypothetical protein